MDAAVDFSDLIDTAFSQYLPRPVVETEIEQCLSLIESRMIVLVGEPGAGKTCLASAQIKARNCLHHFLRKGHIEYSLWRDPYIFLASIGFQLRGLYGEELFPSNVVIDVDQNVHILEESGDVTGIQIQRLVSVPWRDTALHVRQVAGEQKGELRGVEIGELVDDFRHIPLLAFREMAMIAPLRHLKKQKPDERVLLWVDALDEEAGREGSQSDTISAILPTAQELEALGNLWIVVSSRPGTHLDRFQQAGSVDINLADLKFSADNTALAQKIIQAAIERPGVVSAIASAGQKPADIAELVLTRSQGNLLYLEQFFRAAETGGLPALLSGELPAGLEAIQVRLLSALAEQSGADFLQQVYPILKVMAAVKEPLTIDQLKKFSGLSGDQVSAGLARLLPYLDQSGSGASTGYSLYQRSFQETLTSMHYQAKPWHVDLLEAHDCISGFYFQSGQLKTQALDDYALEHLASHLAAGTLESQQRLLTLLDRDWRKLRRQASGSNWPFIADLQKALQVVQLMPVEQAVPAAAALSMMGAMIHDSERWLPDGALKAMTRLGMLQRALGAVSPEMEVRDQISRLTEIVAGIAAQTPDASTRPDVFYQLLRQAMELLDREPGGFNLAQLLEACPIENSPDMDAFLQDVQQIIMRLPADWERPRAVIEYARLLGGVDPDQARGWFQTALDDCQLNLRSSLTLEQARLMRYWVAFDLQAAADALDKMQLYRDEYSVRTVLILGRALEQAGQAGAFRDLLEQARSKLVEGQDDVYKLALCRAETGAAFVELGDFTSAKSELGMAVRAAQAIGTPADSSKDSNRMQTATDAWIAAAGLAAALQAPEAMDYLEHAWNLYSQHGTFNTPVRRLIDLQRLVEPGLLEVYISQVLSPDRKASALLQSVDALLDANTTRDQVLARRWLDQASEYDYHQSFGDAGIGRLYYAAAVVFPLDQYQAADELLSRQLSGEELMAFRLDLARRMNRANISPGDVLKQAFMVWKDGVSNENYYADLPVALSEFTDDQVLPLVELRDSIPDATRRFYFDCALSARLERAAPGSGKEMFIQALGALESAVAQRTPAAELQAFAAGQWWDLDPVQAHSLWLQALAWLNSVESFQQDTYSFHYWLGNLIEALGKGQPGVALQHYLASPAPHLPPGVFFLTVPGILVDAFDQAGMERRDIALSQYVGEALVRGETWATEYAPDLLPQAARSLAYSKAASQKGSSARRMLWAERAIEAAAGIEPDYLSWQLVSEGVYALTLLGAHQKAAAHARRGVQVVLQSLPIFGTKPATAYAHAMGRFLAAQLAAGEITDAVYNLFASRRLGSSGLIITLSGLCQQLVQSDSTAALQELIAKVETAQKLI